MGADLGPEGSVMHGSLRSAASHALAGYELTAILPPPPPPAPVPGMEVTARAPLPNHKTAPLLETIEKQTLGREMAERDEMREPFFDQVLTIKERLALRYRQTRGHRTSRSGSVKDPNELEEVVTERKPLLRPMRVQCNMRKRVLFFKNGVEVDEARPFGTLFARRGRGRRGPAPLPAIVRAARAAWYIVRRSSRRRAFPSSTASAASRRWPARLLLERAAQRRAALPRAARATNLAILPRAGNSPAAKTGRGDPGAAPRAASSAEHVGGVAAARAPSRARRQARAETPRRSFAVTAAAPRRRQHGRRVCAARTAPRCARPRVARVTHCDRARSTERQRACRGSIAVEPRRRRSTPDARARARRRSGARARTWTPTACREAVLTARSRSLRRRSGVFGDLGTSAREPPADCGEEEHRWQLPGTHAGDRRRRRRRARGPRRATPPPDASARRDASSDSRTFRGPGPTPWGARSPPPPPPPLSRLGCASTDAAFEARSVNERATRTRATACRVRPLHGDRAGGPSRRVRARRRAAPRWRAAFSRGAARACGHASQAPTPPARSDGDWRRASGPAVAVDRALERWTTGNAGSYGRAPMRADRRRGASDGGARRGGNDGRRPGRRAARASYFAGRPRPGDDAADDLADAVPRLGGDDEPRIAAPRFDESFLVNPAAICVSPPPPPPLGRDPPGDDSIDARPDLSSDLSPSTRTYSAEESIEFSARRCRWRRP